MSATMAAPAPLNGTPVELLLPSVQTSPFVYTSPHSGDRYDPAFIAATRLDPLEIRRSEDSFVDAIFAGVTGCGSPLIRALFPRAYLDPNREPYELDPTMFEDQLPAHANTTSVRVAGGIGTVPRVVASGSEIYERKLRFAEAEERIASCYWPFHEKVGRVLDETRGRFGCAILIDCHSMPSVGGPLDGDSGRRRMDIVLGNRYGAACHAGLIETAREVLTGLGYTVALNAPYAGGYNTRRYGRPEAGMHALQIEINRALYMDERRIERRPGMAVVAEHMTALAEAFNAIDRALLAPRR